MTGIMHELAKAMIRAGVRWETAKEQWFRSYAKAGIELGGNKGKGAKLAGMHRNTISRNVRLGER